MSVCLRFFVMAALLLVMPLAQATTLLWEPMADASVYKISPPVFSQKTTPQPSAVAVKMQTERLRQDGEGDRAKVVVDKDTQLEFIITDEKHYPNGAPRRLGRMLAAEEPRTLVLTR